MICHCTKENLGLSLSPVSYRHTSVSVYSASGFTILHDLVKSKKANFRSQSGTVIFAI